MKLTCRVINACGQETQINYKFHIVEWTAHPNLSLWLREHVVEDPHKWGTKIETAEHFAAWSNVDLGLREDLETRKSLLRWMNELFFVILQGGGGRWVLKEQFSLCVRGKLKTSSLTLSEGKKRNRKPVPYVTGWTSEAGAASLSASVPFIQPHAGEKFM